MNKSALLMGTEEDTPLSWLPSSRINSHPKIKQKLWYLEPQYLWPAVTGVEYLPYVWGLGGRKNPQYFQ